jgi:hypothetical protein
MLYLHDVITRLQARVARYRREIVSGRQIGESIDIDRLICPLRYDVFVRIEFIRLLRDQWDLYSDNLQDFLDRPQSRAYRTWFREIACARFMPQVYRDDQLFEPVFVKRVHETATLLRSIDRNGYDSSTPIRLASGRSIHAVNGKVINSSYFAADGCHRMSCLYLTGQTRLDPEQYEVEIHPTFRPLDNTAILIDRLPLDRATYLRFVSPFYCDGSTLDSADKILEYVALNKASLLPEAKAVLAFDLARINQT